MLNVISPETVWLRDSAKKYAWAGLGKPEEELSTPLSLSLSASKLPQPTADGLLPQANGETRHWVVTSPPSPTTTNPVPRRLAGAKSSLTRCTRTAPSTVTASFSC